MNVPLQWVASLPASALHAAEEQELAPSNLPLVERAFRTWRLDPLGVEDFTATVDSWWATCRQSHPAWGIAWPPWTGFSRSEPVGMEVFRRQKKIFASSNNRDATAQEPRALLPWTRACRGNSDQGANSGANSRVCICTTHPLSTSGRVLE